MRKKNLLSLVLTIMVMLSSFTSMTFADNSKEQLSIDFTTDKKEYKQGEYINIEISIKNTSGKDLKDVEIKNTLPKGIELKSSEGGEKIDNSNVKWTLKSLKNNESAKFKLLSNFTKYQTVVPVPNTGTDYFNYLLIGSILLLISTIGVIYIKKNPSKFNKKKATSKCMALVMTLGVLGQSLVVADASSNKLTINKTLKLKCDGKELDNILEVKGVFVDDIETGNPVEPEVPEKPETPDEDLLDPENPKWNIDTDKDGLSDGEEEVLGTDPNKVDTDGDMLNDKFEVESNLNPNKKDSDDNGILDSEEDLDNDRLKNTDEQKHNTSAIIKDTDVDGLNDYEEVNKYNTNPLEKDTDKDGIDDGKEIELGTNPNNKDTDGNGINDGDEKYEVNVETPNSDKDKNIDINICGNVDGSNIDDLYITNMEGAHEFISKDIPGYVAAPFRIGNNGNGTGNVNITFTLNEEIVKNNTGDEFALYKYNKDDQKLEIVSEPKKLNYAREKDYTFSIKNIVLGNEYYEYIVLNKTKWDEAWSKEMIDPGNDSGLLDIVLTIDSSGSMDWNDPHDLRKQESIDFINKLEGDNRAAVVDFDEYATLRQDLTTDKNLLQRAINKIDSSGGTNISRGLRKAIDVLDSSNKNRANIDYDKYTTYSEGELISDNIEKVKDVDYIEDISNVNDILKQKNLNARNKFIMLLTDGESTVDSSLIQEAKAKGIKIYTIGLGNGIDSKVLENISNETGGKYQYGETSESFIQIFKELANGTINLIQDTDGDGIPDYFEENMRLVGGIFVKLDPNKKDTDGDGIDDGQEITGKKDPTPQDFHSMYIKEQKAFRYISRPDLEDTDGDGINDKEDENAKLVNVSGYTLLKSAHLSYENTEDYLAKFVSDVKFTKTSLGSKNINDLKDWKIIYADNPYEFGCVVLKKGDTAIIAYTGSAVFELSGAFDTSTDVYKDYIKEHLKAFLGMGSYQKKEALNVLEIILRNSSIKNIYITGHSLGGYLTQIAAHNLNAVKRDGKILKEAMTFNSEPIPSTLYLNPDPGYIYSDINVLGYRNNGSDRFIHNYHIKNDALHSVLIEKMGYLVLGDSKKVYDLNYKFLKEGFKAHALENFYGLILSFN